MSNLLRLSKLQGLKPLSVKKGDTIMVPLQSVNRLKSIWGEDAYEFR